MSTEPLALKYRPQTWDDLVGQPAVQTILKQMALVDKVPHAILLDGSRGTGKAQPLGALVLTPDRGFVPMGKIQVGDEVIDPAGEPSRVLGVYPQGVLPVYRLTFSDGSSCEASGDHLWSVTGRRNPSTYRQTSTFGYQSLVLTTEQLADDLRRYRVNSPLRLPTVKEMDFAENVLPLEPYLLGLLLGDGSMVSGSPTFSSADPALIESKASQGKFVPPVYKYASTKTRLSVLQGLMDTDGWQEKGSAGFSSASRQLRDDVVWLARSLGFVASSKVRHDVTFTYRGEQRKGRDAFQARIIPTEGSSVFRLPRKQGAFKRRSGPQRFLNSVEYVGDKACQCISVSAKSNLYVTNDFIPTHNTTTARILAAALNCEANSGSSCTSCASCKAISDGTSLDVLEIDAASNGLVGDIRQLREQILYSVGGRKRVVLLDEAHSMSREAFNALLKTLEEPPPNTVFVLITTEPSRILETVLSRCMSFTFKRISVSDIVDRLKYICDKESLEIEPALISALAERADGGLRDAVMSLDQMSRAGITTYDQFTSLTGETDFAPTIVKAMASGDVAAVFELVADQMNRTGDAASISNQLVSCLRDILVLRSGGSIAKQGDSLIARQTLASQLEPDRVFAALRVLWELKTRVRIGDDPRTSLDLAGVMVTEALARDGRPVSVQTATPDSPKKLSLNEMRHLT